ncbi:unnamed protein product [Chrysoparadoxa australica]
MAPMRASMAVRSALSRATSRDDDPTPGYLLLEITKMTLNSYEECQQVLNYLQDRIKRKHHNIKLKCLVVIKHVCLQGRVDFKKDMQRGVEDIRACLSFSGPPDALRGDVPYKQVREAAKEALEAIYSDGSVSESIGGVYCAKKGQSYGGRIQGFGGEPELPDRQSSDKTTGMAIAGGFVAVGNKIGSTISSVKSSGGAGSADYSGGLSTSSGSMVGIGNYDPSQDKTWLEKTSDKVKAGVGSVDTKIKQSIKGVSGRYLQRGASGSDAAEPYLSKEQSFGYQNATASYAEASEAHERGFGWSQGGAPRQAGVGGGWAGLAVPPASAAAASTLPQQTAAEVAQGDSVFAMKMVEKICAAGGTRSLPPKDDLDAFVQAARNQEVDVIGSALLEKLQDQDYRCQSKALASMAALIQASDGYREYYKDAVDDIQPLAVSRKSSVRDKAVKIIVSLGFEPQTEDRPSGATATTTTSDATDFNLLGDYSTTAAAPKMELQAGDGTAGNEDLLEGFKAPTAPTAADLASFGGVNAGLMQQDLTPPNAAPAPAPVPTEAAGLFGDMEVKSEAFGSADPPSALAMAPVSDLQSHLAPSSNGFAFMNGSGSEPAPQATPAGAEAGAGAAGTGDLVGLLSDLTMSAPRDQQNAFLGGGETNLPLSAGQPSGGLQQQPMLMGQGGAGQMQMQMQMQMPVPPMGSGGNMQAMQMQQQQFLQQQQLLQQQQFLQQQQQQAYLMQMQRTQAMSRGAGPTVAAGSTMGSSRPSIPSACDRGAPTGAEKSGFGFLSAGPGAGAKDGPRMDKFSFVGSAVEAELHSVRQEN